MGWSTNSARLCPLGSDEKAFVFSGAENRQDAATVTFGGQQFDFSEGGHVTVRRGDVIGCRLDLDRGLATWSRNETELPQVLRLPEKLLSEPFFPGT